MTVAATLTVDLLLRTEIWLDGGYPLSMLPKMRTLIQRSQPHATAFNGLGFFTQGPTQTTRLSPSPVRWIGTESGLPNADDIWSTAKEVNDYSGVGDPDSAVFAPPGCDTVIQNGGWFWEPGGARTLADLQIVYHQTVGRNCVIEVRMMLSCFVADRACRLANRRSTNVAAGLERQPLRARAPAGRRGLPRVWRLDPRSVRAAAFLQLAARGGAA